MGICQKLSDDFSGGPFRGAPFCLNIAEVLFLEELQGFGEMGFFLTGDALLWGGEEMGAFRLRNPFSPISGFLTPVRGRRIRNSLPISTSELVSTKSLSWCWGT